MFAGCERWWRERGWLFACPDTAVIWVDAHADVNTPATSSSGNMHGMPVAFFTENGIPYDRIPGCEWLADAPKLDPKNLVYIGLRDLDPGEKKCVCACMRPMMHWTNTHTHTYYSHAYTGCAVGDVCCSVIGVLW